MCCDEITEELSAAAELAASAAGDSPKYAMCIDTNMARWKLFLAVKGFAGTAQPTVEMVEQCMVFMFKTRQRRSARLRRQGLADSTAEVA